MSTDFTAPGTGVDASARAPADDGLETLDQAFSRLVPKLDRVCRVAPETVVVVLQAGAPPELRTPGDLLLPRWPLGRRRSYLLLRTGTVTVPVRLQHLTTVDRESLSAVEVDVEVRLVESEVLGLLTEPGTVGERLLRQTEEAVETSVRAAVGLNRASQLNRQFLTEVLQDRWLPRTFADGALLRVGFSVRRVSGPTDPGDTTDDPTLALAAVLDDYRPPLQVAALGRRPGPAPSVEEALKYSYLPALISVSMSWLFFAVYGLPELRTLPGLAFLLEQLAPLAWPGPGSAGPGDASPVARSNVLAPVLLLAGLLLIPLSRARNWLARLALWPVTYLAAVSALVLVIGVLVRGRLAAELLGVVLLVVWVTAASLTAWRSLWVDVSTLPGRPSQVLWLMAAFALFSPAPIALGRLVFAPELRVAALSVIHNDLSLRWAALLTPTTALLYLCGLLMAVVLWAVYVLWPPSQTTRRRRPVAALIVAATMLAVVGPLAAAAGERRADVIGNASPSEELGFTCGHWLDPDRARPARTVIATGLSCRRVTTFSGFREVASADTGVSLSPVNVPGPAGQRVPGKLVGGHYGTVLVLATTNRLDNHATGVVGIRISDAAVAWRYSCPDREVAQLRWAGTVTGDDSTAGRLTLRGEQPTVLVDCGGRPQRLDPMTGRSR